MLSGNLGALPLPKQYIEIDNNLGPRWTVCFESLEIIYISVSKPRIRETRHVFQSPVLRLASGVWSMVI